MNGKQKSTLRHELRSVGATDTEIGGLLEIANNLGRLKNGSAHALRQWCTWRYTTLKALFLFVTPSLSGLAVGMTLIVLAQSVLPGNTLYPLQEMADTVSIDVDHSRRGAVMMKRAEQVRQLVSEHAQPNLVLATLANYRTEASAYKHTASNYAAFEYCKRNLQEAAAIAPPPERRAIATTLASLNDI